MEYITEEQIQNRIDELDAGIEAGGSDAQLNLWEMERRDLKTKLDIILAQKSQQQATIAQIGYILDTMTVEGLTIAEIITNDDEYKLVRKGVQEAFALQAGTYEHALQGFKDAAAIDTKNLTDRVNQAEQANEQLKSDNKTLETTNYELTIDNENLNSKVTKGADQNHELTQQIEQQKQHIDDLQNQIALGIRGALNVVDIPQDTSKMAAEIIARKVRITDVCFKDINGIDLRLKQAVVVLTGEKVEYEAIYEKRYIILNAAEAEQYKADEAAKKAELEAQNNIPEIKPVNAVQEEAATTEVTTFPEGHQVDANTDGENTPTEGNGPVHEVVQQAETPAVTLDSLKAELESLKSTHGARLDNIERHANLSAVA